MGRSEKQEARGKTQEEIDKNREDEMIKSYRDLKVYQALYSLAKEVFQLTILRCEV